MSEILKETGQPEKKAGQEKKEVRPPEKPARRRKPLPCVNDWDFWRFVLAALSLAWEVAKTFVR